MRAWVLVSYRTVKFLREVSLCLFIPSRDINHLSFTISDAEAIAYGMRVLAKVYLSLYSSRLLTDRALCTTYVN